MIRTLEDLHRNDKKGEIITASDGKTFQILENQTLVQKIIQQ